MSANPGSTPPGEASAPRLRLRTYTQEGAAIVECTGRLTAGVTELLKSEVKGLIPKSKRIILDLTALVQMDSSGLGTLVGLYVSCRTAGCELRLINLNKQVKELLGMTNLFSVFGSVGQHLTKLP
jgi:anti-sigma B factor antagonist